MYKRTSTQDITAKTDQEQLDLETLKMFHQSHIDRFGTFWNQHSLVTAQRQTISRVLYYNSLYQKIIGVPGVILEFGVQWGATMAQLICLRGIYEPYNHTRHIYGFDTFRGLANTSKEHDGTHLENKDYNDYEGYENELERVLCLHENNAPLSHLRKFSLIKGDVLHTSTKWVEDNPHIVVAMAIFDMDLYLPTKHALKTILPRLTKGSLLVFDELVSPFCPGEGKALDEVLSLKKIRLKHDAHQPACAWAVWDGS